MNWIKLLQTEIRILFSTAIVDMYLQTGIKVAAREFVKRWRMDLELPSSPLTLNSQVKQAISPMFPPTQANELGKIHWQTKAYVIIS